MNHKRQIQAIEYRGKQGIEEEPWKQQLPKLHVMPQHTNFNLADQHVVSADFLLRNQTQLAQLFEMVKCDAWATEVECPLDFADADWVAVL